MKCDECCLKRKERIITDIQELFWFYYNKKNILASVYYGSKILNGDYPTYNKEHLIENLQELYKDRGYDRLLSKVGAIEPWTKREEINLIFLGLFLNEQVKNLTTLESLLKLTPSKFEDFISGMLKKLNYYDLKVTNRSHDGGFDVWAKKDGKQILVECKRWSKSNKVTVQKISRLVDAVMRKKADKGIFVTTSSFTKNCYLEQMERTMEIEFWDGKYLMKLIRNDLNLVFFNKKK